MKSPRSLRASSAAKRERNMRSCKPGAPYFMDREWSPLTALVPDTSAADWDNPRSTERVSNAAERERNMRSCKPGAPYFVDREWSPLAALVPDISAVDWDNPRSTRVA